VTADTRFVPWVRPTGYDGDSVVVRVAGRDVTVPFSRYGPGDINLSSFTAERSSASSAIHPLSAARERGSGLGPSGPPRVEGLSPEPLGRPPQYGFWPMMLPPGA